MIINNADLSCLRYILYGYENCNITCSRFDSFLTNQVSGCIYIDSANSLSVYKSSFTNITTTCPYPQNPSIGSAICTNTAKNLIIVSTCFKDCRSDHGYSFGCYGTGFAVYNQSLRTSSVYVSNKHPSFIYDFDSLVSFGTNTSNSLDGTILFNENTCSLKFQLVADSIASPISQYYYFFYIKQATIDFVSVIGGTAAAIFSSANGVTIGNMYASVSCGLGSLIKSINYLYYTIPFQNYNVAFIVNSKSVESLPNELMIPSINCIQEITCENLVANASAMHWILNLLFLNSLYYIVLARRE